MWVYFYVFFAIGQWLYSECIVPRWCCTATPDRNWIRVTRIYMSVAGATEAMASVVLQEFILAVKNTVSGDTFHKTGRARVAVRPELCDVIKVTGVNYWWGDWGTSGAELSVGAKSFAMGFGLNAGRFFVWRETHNYTFLILNQEPRNQCSNGHNCCLKQEKFRFFLLTSQLVFPHVPGNVSQ